MKAIVVYESLWGNTAAIAQAIAEGIGGDARVLSTAQATPADVAAADLIVAGAPLLGFSLPNDAMVKSIADNPASPKGDFSAPSMRTWLAAVQPGGGRCAGFETRIWWSPGSAAKAISRELEAKGRTAADAPAKFLVTGRYGPLKDGETERAKAWGAKLAQSATT